VEILYTVQISIRSHRLVIAEPFLIVGLIASIRRMLVITLEAATLSRSSGCGAMLGRGGRCARYERGALVQFQSTSRIISSMLQMWSEIPASIAGVTRNVLMHASEIIVNEVDGQRVP
jgi:hypothetical protein